LKDYERFVVWLDYFNSELKRSEGRRVPLSSAIRSPKLSELEQACTRLSLLPQPQVARYPRAVRRDSGYVSVKKEDAKQKIILRIARELSIVRGENPKSPQKV
jgi:signal recognition particle subunit SRP19